MNGPSTNTISVLKADVGGNRGLHQPYTARSLQSPPCSHLRRPLHHRTFTNKPSHIQRIIPHIECVSVDETLMCQDWEAGCLIIDHHRTFENSLDEPVGICVGYAESYASCWASLRPRIGGVIQTTRSTCFANRKSVRSGWGKRVVRARGA